MTAAAGGTTVNIKIGSDLNQVNYSIAKALVIIKVTRTLWCLWTTGKILAAIYFSSGVPFYNFNSKLNSSIDINPNVKPEHNPASNIRPKS